MSDCQRILLSTLLRHYEPYEEILFSYFQGIHMSILLRKWRLNYAQDLDAQIRKLKNLNCNPIHIPEVIVYLKSVLNSVKCITSVEVLQRYKSCESISAFSEYQVAPNPSMDEFQELVLWVFNCVKWLSELKVVNNGVEFSKLVELYLTPSQQFFKFEERFQGGARTLIKLEDIMGFLQYAQSVVSLFVVVCRLINVEIDESTAMLICVDMYKKSDNYYLILNPDKSIPLRTHYKKILAPCSQVDLYHGLQGKSNLLRLDERASIIYGCCL
eukprot:NODE_81_length_22758_cov_0.877797.p7 type:complete len:271 gc:universal NODE_81_length_22758_cov_0.877797:20462-19650(-)